MHLEQQISIVVYCYLNNETSPTVAGTVFQDPFQDDDIQLPDHLSNLQEESMLVAYHLLQKWQVVQ